MEIVLKQKFLLYLSSVILSAAVLELCHSSFSSFRAAFIMDNTTAGLFFSNSVLG